MIFDCFTLFNELDILEARLNILNDVVNYHVIVESAYTFAGEPKPLYYERNEERFKNFRRKIFYIRLTTPPSPDRWQNEYAQRNAIRLGLAGAAPNDTILVSDVDEIPSGGSIAWLLMNNKFSAVWDMATYYYDLNHISSVPHRGPVAMHYQELVSIGGAQAARDSRNDRRHHVFPKTHCWHFSCFGGPEAVSFKLKHYAHAEYSDDYWTDPARIAARRDAGQDVVERAEFPVTYVPLGEHLPQWMLDNIDRFPQWTSPK